MNKRRLNSDSGAQPGGPRSDSLSDKSLNALKWNYAGVAAKIVSQLVIGVVLARLLGPEAFGLFAATLLVTGLGGIVAEMGLGAALVQKKDISSEDIRVVFTRLMLAGTIVAGLIISASPWIADIFADPRLEPILLGGALFVLIQAAGTVSASLLKRDLRMKPVQIGQVISYLAGFLGVGLTLALTGFGALSLIAALVSQALIFSMMMYFNVRHPVKPLLRSGNTHFTSFGARVTGTNLANWVIENIDNFMVGKLFGMKALGLYSVAYNLVRTATNHLMVTLQSVLFSASARAQGDDDSLRRAYLATLGLVMLITLPVFAGIASVAITVIETLYGNKWIDATSLLVPLALAMPLHAAMTGSVILWAKGLAGRELRVQLRIALIFPPLLFAASQFSLVALAWTVCLIYLLRSAWLTNTILSSLDLSWRKFALAVRGGLVLGVVISGLLMAMDSALRFANVIAIFRLMLEMLAGLLVSFLVLRVLRKWIFSAEMVWLLEQLVTKFPVGIGRRLRLWFLTHGEPQL